MKDGDAKGRRVTSDLAPTCNQPQLCAQAGRVLLQDTQIKRL
jgi:hypothetical protein